VGDDSKPTVDDKARARRPSAEAPNREHERYTSGTEIARGGMGRVVEATDTRLGRTVALKEALSTDPDALRRFARETMITARLEHPSIVPLYDAGTSRDGSPYYVMRKVSGRPLEELVGAAQSLVERLRLLPHVVAAAQALAHAHQRKVVHRDLKPSNILVGDLGETVVIDWGLAKVLGEDDDDGPAQPRLDAGASLQTRVGTVFGTPGFMAPEQLRGDPVDARVDVYALGATLYYMLARQPPHNAASGDEMMSAAAAGPPKPIAELAPGVPRELTTIVDKALSYRESARYPDAGAFAEDVSRFLTGQLVASHRYSRRERLVRFVRRHRVPVSVVTLAVIALAIGGTLGVLRVLAERDRADAQAVLATKGQRDAQDRADQLMLSQAETLVATNPTAAVAMLKQLTADPVRRAALWREVRAIAASARIAGVARGITGPTQPKTIELSPGGTKAVVAGRDGSIWTYDLATHRARKIVQLVPDRLVQFIGEDQLVLYRDRDFTFWNLTTGARRDLVLPVPVWYVMVGTHRIFASSNENRELHELPLDATRGDQLQRVLTGTIDHAQLSNDARWIAVATADRLAIADVTQPALAFRDHGPGGATTVAWSADARRLLATYPGRLELIDVESAKRTSYPHRDLAYAPIAQASTFMFLSSTGGIRWLQSGQVSTRYLGELETGNGLHAAPGDRVVASLGNRAIIFDGIFDSSVIAPTEGLTRLKASPNGRYLVAATPGRLLYWDFEQIMPSPRVIASEIAAFGRIGRGAFVVQKQDGEWWWLDRETKQEHRLGTMPPMSAVESNLARNRLLFVEPDGGAALLFETKTGTMATIDDRTAFAILTGDDHVLLARQGGGLVLVDPDLKGRRTLVSHKSELEASAWSPGWFAASYLDGMVWRQNTATRREETLRVAAPKLARQWALRLLPDGKLFFPVDNKVMCWRADGTLVEHVVLPETITNTYSSMNQMIVITQDGGGYVVRFDKPGFARSTIPAGARRISMSDTGLAVFETAVSTPEVVDLNATGRWPVVRRGRVGRIKFPTISDDGKTIMALEGTDLVEWPIDVPQDADATAAWLDRLTNATAELGPTTLTWH
jgi:hypothetical protein